MKLTPVSSPAAIKSAPPSDFRAKAIAAFNGQNQSQAPVQQEPQIVQNQNAVSVEELGAIKSPSQPEVDNSTQAAAPEVPEVAPEKPKVEEDPTLTKQFLQLARQEKALRAKAQQQDKAIRAREDAIKAKEAELASKSEIDTSKYISLEDLRANPLKYINYDEVTQQVLSPKDPRVEATINELRNEIKALKQANQDNQKTYTEQQQAAYQSAVKQIKVDVKNLVKADPNTFEAVAKTNSIDDVVELITETYNKDGVLLSVEEATQEVENYLIDQGVNTLGRIDKIKKKLGLGQSQTKVQTLAPQKQIQPMKTLTNATASTRQLSARERAVLAFKGELKS